MTSTLIAPPSPLSSYAIGTSKPENRFSIFRTSRCFDFPNQLWLNIWQQSRDFYQLIAYKERKPQNINLSLPIKSQSKDYFSKSAQGLKKNLFHPSTLKQIRCRYYDCHGFITYLWCYNNKVLLKITLMSKQMFRKVCLNVLTIAPWCHTMTNFVHLVNETLQHVGCSKKILEWEFNGRNLHFQPIMKWKDTFRDGKRQTIKHSFIQNNNASMRR